YTPATNLLFGLREALKMLLEEEGLDAVFARHGRHAEATRRAVTGWGLEVLCAEPREHSNSLTAVLVPDGYDADRVRDIILDGIQEAVLRRLGQRIGGYKVGFSPEGGIFCAPIFASRVHTSPTSLPAKGFHLIGIECEIGFRLDQAFGERARPHTREQVLAA